MNKEKKIDETATSAAETRAASTEETAKDEVFVVVEDQPEFPGGNAALMKFLGDNIKYPVEAQESNIQGRVVTNFVVEKDGSLSDFQVVRGIDPLLDAEAVRVLKAMPNWKPGKQRGHDVRVRFTLPVVFRLQGSDGTAVPPPPPPPPTPYTNSNDKDASSIPPPPPPPPADVKSSNEVFVVVEQQPEFPGGQSALMRFLSDNIKYPAEAQGKNIQGRVTTNFVVEKDGSISDVKVVRSINPLLDEEAIRVVQSMPNWKPGTQKGQTVRVRYTLPVVFRLQK